MSILMTSLEASRRQLNKRFPYLLKDLEATYYVFTHTSFKTGEISQQKNKLRYPYIGCRTGRTRMQR